MENIVDAQCLRFNSYKICSHTVAVADYNEELHKLVEYIKKHSKNRINDLTDVNLSSNVRQKRRKTLKKGGDKHNLKPVKTFPTMYVTNEKADHSIENAGTVSSIYDNIQASDMNKTLPEVPQ